MTLVFGSFVGYILEWVASGAHMCGREILLWGCKLHSTGFVTSIGVQVHELHTKRQVHHALWEWWLCGPKIPSLTWFLMITVNSSRSRYDEAFFHVVGEFTMKHLFQVGGDNEWYFFSIKFQVQNDQLSRRYQKWALWKKQNGHSTQHSMVYFKSSSWTHFWSVNHIVSIYFRTFFGKMCLTI